MIRKVILCWRHRQPIHDPETDSAAVPMSEAVLRIQIRIAAVLMFAAALIAASTLHPETVRTAARANLARLKLLEPISNVNNNAPVGGCESLGHDGSSPTLHRP